jgi:hypothetical protein
MNDDAPSESPSADPAPDLLAASACFDGTADADERALVDASPELRRMVAGFAQVKTALNDLPPVPANELDDAIAAALAEFDVLGAVPAAAAASPRVVPMARPTRWSRVLTVAAAAVVLGVVGVAVVKGIGGSNDSKSSTAAQTAFDASSAAPAVAGAAAESGAGATSTIGAINVSADVLPQYDQPKDLRTLPGTIAPTAGGVGADSAPPAATAGAGTPGAKNAAQPLTGPLVFPFTCPLTAHQVFIAEILWRGAPAAAVRDTVTGVTQALDAQCNVLISVEP